MPNVKKGRLTEGPVALTLIKLTIPMILGVLGMVIFNLVDTFFVGQLGTAELAALSFTFPVVLVVSSLAMGLGAGASAVISRAIGEGNHYKVQRLTTDSLSLSILVVVMFVVLGLLTIEPVFRLLGATPDVMPLIKEYMTIWYLGVLVVIVPMVGNNAIRATGDTTTPSAIMMVAVVTNIILDPLLIFGLGPFPRLELAGAALATVIARTLTLAVALWVLYYRDRMMTLARPNLYQVWASWKQVLYIGLPAAGTNMIIPVGMGIITGLVASYGPPAVAALGVATRIEMFALTIIMALGSVLGPFVGQNWGAGQQERVKLGVKYSQLFAFGWGIITFLLLLILSRPLAALFTDNPAVINTIVLYLWIVPLSYSIQNILLLSTIVLNVLNRPFQAFLLIILRMLILYVPLAYLGSLLFGLEGIFGAAIGANFAAGLAAYGWLRYILAVSEPTPFSEPSQKLSPQPSKSS